MYQPNLRDLKMKKNVLYMLALLAAFGASQASATVLTEDFNAPFPNWESGWLGTNSNLQNVYGVGAGRGNNPDGLWVSDGNNNDNIAHITFNTAFGSTISNFSIDVTSWVQPAVFTAFDKDGNTLISAAITSYGGALSNPGSYQTIVFSSLNGVSGFDITGGQIEGNTGIDNVVVNAGATRQVPEPAALALLGIGLAGLGATRRRKLPA